MVKKSACCNSRRSHRHCLYCRVFMVTEHLAYRRDGGEVCDREDCRQKWRSAMADADDASTEELEAADGILRLARCE